MITPQDKDTLRRLAAEQAEIAALPVQREKIEMWTRLNGLRPVRPMVSMFQIPWHELWAADDELTLKTSDTFCQAIEKELRQRLYLWRHIRLDMVMDDRLYCPIVVNDTGFGLKPKTERLHTAPGSVASRNFEPLIQSEADIEKIKTPLVTVDWEQTEKNLAMMKSIFDGVIEVERRGIPGVNFQPWDILIQWWGVEQAMMDLAMRPELVHMAMTRLSEAMNARLDQWEALGVLALNNGNYMNRNYGCQIGGGLCYTNELPSADSPDAPEHPKAKHLWGRAMAQIFSDVSPEMHEEFALRYERPWLHRFGLSYYGCCEPLSHKIDILRSIKNLRKISISPWSDIPQAAKAIGEDYVLSFKPNPAHVAVNTWDAELVRRYLTEVLEQTKDCAVEMVLKDISTVRSDPRRLKEWARVAMEVVEGIG